MVIKSVEEKGIYLDYAATTPLAPEVREAMVDFLGTPQANPASIHKAGRKSAFHLEQSRRVLADWLNAEPAEIIFTSGGTEAINLALFGLAYAHRSRGPQIISSRVEHAATEKTLQRLEQLGFKVRRLETDKYGRVSPAELEKALQEVPTALVSLLWVHNELGSINDVQKLGELCRAHGALVHIDAVQAAPVMKIDTATLPADAISLSAHKIYGPTGVGALWLRSELTVEPLLRGGSQERGVRPGTPNTVGCVGFAAAVKTLQQNFASQVKHLEELRSVILQELQAFPNIQVNTPPADAAPHILSITPPPVNGGAMFICLDLEGIAVSNGAACSSGTQQPSRILLELGFSPDEAERTIRISWGCYTTAEELRIFLRTLKEVLEDLQSSA